VSTSDKSNDEWYADDNNPRWPYDKYMRTYFVKPLRYDFVRQWHDKSLATLREGVIGPTSSRARHLATIAKVEQTGIQRLFEFIDIVYTSLEQLRKTDPQKYFERMQEYYRRLGTSKPFDATPRTAQGLIDAAKRLPTLVEA
jgi:hypothetical protein